MRLFAVLLVFAVGCGPTECQNYAVVYCGKAVQCGYSSNGIITYPARDACERDAARQFQAVGVTEEQCKAVKGQVAGMSCEQFWKFAAGG